MVTEARFLLFVNVEPHPEGCWWWTGDKTAGGYGRLPENREFRAERFSYRHYVGPIQTGMDVVQSCRSTSCVRPEHLRLVAAAGKPQGHQSRRGEANTNARLTQDDVLTIRKLRRAGASLSALSKRFGVTKAHVTLVAQGKRWAHLPDPERD